MPIVASRGVLIRKLISELIDPRRRDGAMLRLRAVGARVVPHAAEELGRLDIQTRRALIEALADVDTADSKSLKKRLAALEPASDARNRDLGARSDASAETNALADLHALPPPRRNERPAISRKRGEAHLDLARAGSRLARRELLMSLSTLAPDRSRLYCEAASLIGDADFIEPLAQLAGTRPEAIAAIAAIAAREKITRSSKVLRNLNESLRKIVLQAPVMP